MCAIRMTYQQYLYTLLGIFTVCIYVYSAITRFSNLQNHGPLMLVTDELPAMFTSFPNDRRAQVVLELYTTERTYVRGLETVIEVKLHSCLLQQPIVWLLAFNVQAFTKQFGRSLAYT